MNSQAAPPNERHRSMSKIFLAGVVLSGTLSLLALYWVSAFIFLSYEVGEEAVGEVLLSGTPERFTIQWDRGRSYFPGVVQLEGVELSINGRSHQTWLQVDRGAVQVGLRPLLSRQLWLSNIDVSGAEFRIRRRRDGEEGRTNSATDVARLESLAVSEGLPPIPGRLVYAPPPSQKKGRWLPPWLLRIEIDQATDWERLWFGKEQLRGDVTVSGATAIRLRKTSFELAESHLEIRGGQWLRPISSESSPSSAGSPEEVSTPPLAVAGDALDIDLVAGFDRFSPAEVKGRESLAYLDSSLRIRGEVRDFEFLSAVAEAVPSLDVAASGQLEAEIEIADGQLMEGSRWDLRDGRLRVAILDLEMLGVGTASVRLTNSLPEGVDETFAKDLSSDDLLHASVSLPMVTVGQKGQSGGGATVSSGTMVARTGSTTDLEQAPARSADRAESPLESSSGDLEGGSADTGLRLHLASAAPNLAEQLEPPKMRLDLGESEVGDAAWLMRRFGFPGEPSGGHGTLVGFLEYDSAEHDGKGEIQLTLENLQLGDLEARLGTKVNLQSRVENIDLEARVASSAESSLVVEAEMAEGHPLGAELTLVNSCLRFPKGSDLEAASFIELKVEKLRPFLDIAQLPAAVGWADRLFDFEHLRGTSRAALADRSWRFHEMSLSEEDSERVELLGDLGFGAAGLSGILFFRWRDLSAALALDDRQRDWKLTRSRSWFDARVAEEAPPRSVSCEHES